MRVPDASCRLTVQHCVGDDLTAVDLALPRAMQVGQLLPAIVDIVSGATVLPLTPHRWRLSRLGGPRLDETKTLAENDIRDGDLLLLTATDPPPPVWVAADPCHTVANIADTGTEHDSRIVAIIGCLVSNCCAAAALAWSSAAPVAHLTGAACLALGAAAGAVTMRRARNDESLATTLSVVAVVFAAVTGALAVPAGPAAAHALLAASAAFSVSTLLARLAQAGRTWLTATATVALASAAVALATLNWNLSSAATGAVLATLALAVLSVAPRFSIAVTGIGPPPPSIDPTADTAPEVDTHSGIAAHRMLTGLVIGSSLTATLGTVLVASAGPFFPAATFSAIIGFVLLLRARSHIDAMRRVALSIGGFLCVAACLAVCAVAFRAQAHIVAVVAAAAGAAALAPACGVAITPLMRRAADVTEYFVLAAVVPTACWVGGLFAWVRGLGLL
ncbi:type VII secretion integral membrane protein EccD [Mycobacterium deserti]|uniref:Type VII secretion integral membrane protein EccD n=1 Tax=Mycobacterium deserti TaxID=2978347 RepID=A0ABT2M767_9MYCO|nr:type VII secretion integral membrane protein EccD [Mycobacterium deserti]MCT7658117.1 type VII secretion integral membrane protein EccD [Mycobacterium deserti]